MSFTDKDKLKLEFPILKDTELSGEFASDSQLDDIIASSDSIIKSYLISKFTESQVQSWLVSPHEVITRLANYLCISQILQRVGSNDADENKLNSANTYHKKYRQILDDVLTGKIYLVPKSNDVRLAKKSIKYATNMDKYRI